MSQPSQKGRNAANTLSLSNPVKPTAKSKADRSSVDETEPSQKAKDVVKETKDVTKPSSDEKHSTKKEKIEKNEEKNTSKTEDKLKNGSASSDNKISNGSHKNEESTSEEKKTRETRQKASAAKESKTESSQPSTSDSKLSAEKQDKTAEKPAANKEKEIEKEKDKDTVKASQRDKKAEKEEKTSVKDTLKKESKDAKSSSPQQQTLPKEKDNKDMSESSKTAKSDTKSETAKSKTEIIKLKPEIVQSKFEKSETVKPKKSEEKPKEASPAKENKSKPIEPVVWDNDEMEPLMMQVDIEEKTPQKQSAPSSTSTPTPSSRILRMRAAPPVRNDSPLSLLTVDDPKNNTSTYVNLSTLTNPHSAEKSYGAKMRSVSGRRSTRPNLREIGVYNSYREQIKQNESYSSNAINESNSSGYLDYSQRSMNTSSFVSRKRFIEEREHFVEEVDNSKRPRLDVSGLLNLVSSPVTMLRNRLARARIQSSTPNSQTNINKDDVEIDTVSASCIDEAKEAGLEEEYDDEVVGGGDLQDEDMMEIALGAVDGQTNTPDENDVHKDITVKILKETNKLESSPFVPNDAIKKKWNCSLM